MRTLISVLALSALLAGTAQADVQDRVVTAPAQPEALYQEIVVAATAVCADGAAIGQVYNMKRCVAEVVDLTVAELNQPALTQFAQAAAAKRST